MSFCQSCGAALAGAQGETWGLFFRTIRKFDGRRIESKISLSLRPEGKQPRVANMLVEDHLRPAATKAAFFPHTGMPGKSRLMMIRDALDFIICATASHHFSSAPEPTPKPIRLCFATVTSS
jgi:hypothetical protein